MHSAAKPELIPESQWQQILERAPQADFLYGVTTTGIYCRTGCPSRRPKREHVRVFGSPAEAEAGGFRPCQRCRPMHTMLTIQEAMEKVRLHLEANVDRGVSLDELSRMTGLSPTTVQKQFRATMGASPLTYQRALRTAALRQGLKGGATVTDAIYAAGFQSSSSVYEENSLGMTPLRFAQGGRGEEIGMWTAETVLGWISVGATKRGLCWLALAESAEKAEETLREEFPAAQIRRDAALAHWVEKALAEVEGGPAQGNSTAHCGELDVRGTAFQLRVWDALRRIPRGETMSYSQLAEEMGNPRATRAVARACATNRVALLVPCHRIVGADGSLTGYRWGVERKRTILAAEKKGERGEKVAG